jgi:hypothetical protein
MDDIGDKLDSLITLLRDTKPTGRHFTWEFTLFGGSETVQQTTYDPTTDTNYQITQPGSGKNTLRMNFVTGQYAGKSVTDVAVPFVFPYRPLFALQIVNEIPSGAGSGADIRVSINTPKQDYNPIVLIRSNDSYSTGIQNGPTFIRLSAVNNQSTNTAIDSYVRVIGMA